MMNQLLKRPGFSFVAVLAAVIVAGCDNRPGETAQQQPTPATAAVDALPSALALPDAPPGAKDVLAVKKDAKEGDAVVIRGRVGGSKSPFVDGRASFQLVDRSLKACGEGTAMDECKTPWDYCCSEAKEVAAHSATVQVVGADGRPLHAGLSGFAGLKPLSDVTVTGTVAKAGQTGTLVVNATGIHAN
jgi:hypothetical protein